MEIKFTKISDRDVAELEFMTELDHPNIVHTISVEAIAGGGSLITMECLSGVTLKEFVGEHGELSAADTVYIGERLCRGIAYLHGLTPTWLYCDMKPENVMITGEPGDIQAVVITDIDGGCLMKLDGLAPEKSYGTKGFAAPEQMDPSGSLDMRVDVYGICATLDAIYKRPGLLKRGLDKRLQAIIKKGTSPEIKDRYFTVNELYNELKILRA